MGFGLGDGEKLFNWGKTVLNYFGGNAADCILLVGIFILLAVFIYYIKKLTTNKADKDSVDKEVDQLKTEDERIKELVNGIKKDAFKRIEDLESRQHESGALTNKHEGFFQAYFFGSRDEGPDNKYQHLNRNNSGFGNERDSSRPASDSDRRLTSDNARREGINGQK